MTANVVRMSPRDWRRMLKMKENKKGVNVPEKEPGNAYLMLSNGEWENVLSYDEFGDRMFWARQPPVLGEDFVRPKAGADVQDHHRLYVQHYLSTIGNEAGQIPGASFSLEAVTEAIGNAARKNSVHPLKMYLTGLVWDGTPRLATWCHDFLGGEQSDYSASIGKWWMISAVARALEPGCQADHMLLLEGEQGARKSTALRILGGDWYLPELPDVRSRDAAHSLYGRWIVECGELETLKKSGVTANAIKDFLTRMVDVYRLPYGHFFVRRPRCVVFAGTTNDYQAFNDPTGARRFWPYKCGEIDARGLERARDQLWAEAVERFNACEQWHPTKEMADAIAEQQEARFQVDSWEDRVLSWCRSQVVGFGISQVLSGPLDLPPRDWTKSAEQRAASILHRAGYRVRRPRVDGRRVNEYYLPGRAPAREPGEDDE